MSTKYVDNLSQVPFEGGFARNEAAAWATALLTKIQRDHGVFGGIGEIGVHIGSYFVSMALTARVGEPLFALDIFQEEQHKNLDRSGNGDLRIFLHNVRTMGIPEDRLVIHTGSSTEITVGQLCAKFESGFRLLSIDGGHYKKIVISDLLLAECCMLDGGIVSMDDQTNAYWPGVHEGVASYLDRYGATSRLAPFFIHANKLYLTTKTHHARYLAAITSLPFWDDACESTVFVHEGKRICMKAPGVNTGDEHKFQLGGYAIAVAAYKGFNEGKARQLWKDSLQGC